VEALPSGLPDGRERGFVGRVPLGPADVRVRRVDACREEADERQRARFRDRVGRPQAEPLAEVGIAVFSASGLPSSSRSAGTRPCGWIFR
jgi:hypothetical protein